MNRIHTALTFDAYRQLDGDNFSAIRHVDTSELHYQFARTKPERPPGKHIRIGHAVHATITGVPLPIETPPFIYEGAVRRGKEWLLFAAGCAHADPTREIILRTEADRRAAEPDTVKAMCEAVLADRRARMLFETGAGEVSLQWTHAKTGRLLKARLDWADMAAPSHFLDIKTTARITRDAFARLAEGYLYHAQLGHYANGVEAVTSEWPEAYWVVIESSPPHDVVVYHVPDEVLVAGWRTCEGWLARVAAAEASGVWHGVAGGKLLTYERPAWAAAMGAGELTMGGVPLDEAGAEVGE